MTLRNVPKAHTLEQQRQEINLIASDLDTAVDGTQTFGGEKTFTGDITFTNPAGIDFYDGATYVGRLGQQSTDRVELEGNQGLHLSANGDVVIKDRNWSTYRAIFRNEGAVELYYPEPFGSVTPGVPGVGTKRFETSSTGVTVIGTLAADGVTIGGDISIGDSDQILFGDDADLKIYYDGTVGIETSFIDSDALQIRSESDTSELYATFLKDGPVELYYDGTKKFGTSASGASVLGNLEVSTDITCNSIINNAGGVPTFSIFNTGNALFEDVEATSLHMKDDRPAYFGTNEDASLYYDSASSELRLESEVGFHVRWYDSVNTQYEDQAIFSPFGSTRFYYQGAANPTLSIDDGIDIDGVVTVGSNTEAGAVSYTHLTLPTNREV